MTSPLVSVVLPTYRAKDTIGSALSSMVNQSYKNSEIIVVNEDPGDGTRSACAPFAAQYKNIHIEDNPGTGFVDSLNHGINIAQGKYIARMDADDVSHPERLATQIAFLEANPQVDAVGSSIYYLLKEHGRDAKTQFPYGEGFQVDFPSQSGQICENLKDISNYWVFAHGAVTMRARALRDIGGYRKQYSEAEDIDLWVRFMRNGNILANINSLLYSLDRTRISKAKRNLTTQYLQVAVLITQANRPHTANDKKSPNPISFANLENHCKPDELVDTILRFIYLSFSLETQDKYAAYDQIKNLFAHTLRNEKERFLHGLHMVTERKKDIGHPVCQQDTDYLLKGII